MFRDVDIVVDLKVQYRGVALGGVLLGNVLRETYQWFLKVYGEEKRSHGVSLLDTGDAIESDISCPY